MSAAPQAFPSYPLPAASMLACRQAAIVEQRVSVLLVGFSADARLACCCRASLCFQVCQTQTRGTRGSAPVLLRVIQPVHPTTTPHARRRRRHRLRKWDLWPQAAATGKIFQAERETLACLLGGDPKQSGPCGISAGPASFRVITRVAYQGLVDREHLIRVTAASSGHPAGLSATAGAARRSRAQPLRTR
jgi:hypothetical protein